MLITKNQANACVWSIWKP